MADFHVRTISQDAIELAYYRNILVARSGNVNTGTKIHVEYLVPHKHDVTKDLVMG